VKFCWNKNVKFFQIPCNWVVLIFECKNLCCWMNCGFLPEVCLIPTLYLLSILSVISCEKFCPDKCPFVRFWFWFFLFYSNFDLSLLHFKSLFSPFFILPLPDSYFYCFKSTITINQLLSFNFTPQITQNPSLYSPISISFFCKKNRNTQNQLCLQLINRLTAFFSLEILAN
jgi:hypothetical protein